MSGASERYRGVAPLPAIGGVARELAVDQVAEHRVALARLAAGERAGAVDALLRRVGACRHPSLAPVLDTVAEDDGAIIQVEAQADGPLLRSSVRMPQASALLVAADVAEALAALHAGGLVHGGLGPDAVLLDGSGRALVLGAGLGAARALVDGAPQPDASDDLRALGRVLYALVTGREPAATPMPPSTLVPDLAPALNGLVLALLSEDPRRPPPPAAATAERLRALAGVALPVDVRPPEPERPPVPEAPRRGISDAALAAIVGGIALVAIILAVAVTATGDLIDLGDGGDSDTQPAFTLPEADTLTLTMEGDQLPLPDVLTDTSQIDTVVPTDTFEIFTDTYDSYEYDTVDPGDTGSEDDIVTITG